MRRRFERVEAFFAYLHEEEEAELRDLSLPVEGEYFYGPFIPEIRRQYEREKEFIRARFRATGLAID